MKLGIIRCMQTEDYCPGSRDFRTIRERKGAFMGEDDIQLVGFINCGGCPGKKAVLRDFYLDIQKTTEQRMQEITLKDVLEQYHMKLFHLGQKFF